jgi:hypothetical protein
MGLYILKGAMVELWRNIILPEDKLSSLSNIYSYSSTAKKATLRSFQSLIGMLNFACKVIPPGRAFSRRLIYATKGGRPTTL